MLQVFKIWFLSKIHKRIYKPFLSIEFLPIWNYKQIEKTGDCRYLLKGIDYECMPKIHIDLVSIWEKIRDSFIEQSAPEKIGELGQEFIHFAMQHNQYNYLQSAVQILANKDFISEKTKQDLISKIRILGYRFDDSSNDNYFNSILDLKRQLVGLATKIRQKDAEIIKKNEENKKEPVDIEDTLTLFTQTFGTVFNSKKLTCKQYLSYLKRYNKIAKEANERSKQTNKQGNGR